VKHALTKNVALIQGPPGTGKTFAGELQLLPPIVGLLFMVSDTASDGAAVG